MGLMKLALRLVLSTFLCLAGFNVAAQSNQNYSTSWDTATSFDQIPFGNLVRYIFRTVRYAKEHDVFDSHELSLIHNALMENPKLERTYRLFEEGCNLYQESGAGGNDLDLEYMGNLFNMADQYGSEDQMAPYLTAYEKLSEESMRFVLDKTESLRGTRLMSSSTNDWVKVFRDRPESAMRSYDKLCAGLPAKLEELENQAEQKKFKMLELLGLIEGQHITISSIARCAGLG